MAGFKENLEEQYVRRKYKRFESFIYVVLLLVFGIFFSLMTTSDTILNSLFNMPFLDKSKNGYFLFLILVWISSIVWWYGAPSIIDRIIPKKNKHLKKLRKGRKSALDSFFFQEITVTDGMSRSKEFIFLRGSKYTPTTLFDFDPVTIKRDPSGTRRVVSYFRDSDYEKFVKTSNAKSARFKDRAKIAGEEAKHFKIKHFGTGNSTENQLEKFMDLLSIAEGMLQGYGTLRKKKIKSPLTIKIRNSEIVRYFATDAIDVYQDGNVYFSIDMIMDTVNNLSILFYRFTKERIGKNGGVEVGSDLYKGGMTKILDFFKFVMFRRILNNYGWNPSGWYVARIEDYSLRAIFSAVDRKVVPKITSLNDGRNRQFSSDVYAMQWLTLYWSFMDEIEIVPLMETIEWSFNAIKDVSDIRMRDFAKESAAKSAIDFGLDEGEEA